MTNPETEGTTSAPHEEKSLTHELRTLGTQIEAVVRAFLASDKAHQMQQELQSGVNELVTRLQDVAKSEQVSEVSEKGKQMVEKAFENPKVVQAHSQVVSGLSSLNEELRKLAESFAESTKPSETTPPSADDTTPKA